MRSDDLGKTWHHASDGLQPQYVRWLAYHPDISDCEFAGTEPADIFVSRDGAKTGAKAAASHCSATPITGFYRPLRKRVAFGDLRFTAPACMPPPKSEAHYVRTMVVQPGACVMARTRPGPGRSARAAHLPRCAFHSRASLVARSGVCTDRRRLLYFTGWRSNLAIEIRMLRPRDVVGCGGRQPPHFGTCRQCGQRRTHRRITRRRRNVVPGLGRANRAMERAHGRTFQAGG